MSDPDETTCGATNLGNMNASDEMRSPHSAQNESEDDCRKQFESASKTSDGKPMCPGGAIDKPKVGMEFDTYDALVEHYATYARQEGFAVCKRTSKKGKDGRMRYAVVQCYRGGKPREKGANSLKSRPQSRVNCPARVRACLSVNDKWMVTLVCLEHNHEQSPGKARCFKSNRIIDDETKRKLEFHDKAEIRLKKTFDVLQIEAGGLDQKYSADTRRLRFVEGDAEAMNRYFTMMKADNEDFFYALDLDEECRLRNVFWADARSRAACKEFGDVVTFDTTCLVNRYRMPFVSFVSVNHHGHSVLLGCGLVSHEDTKAFIWLFETWLACMRGCAPKAIITDQCIAIKNAIEYVFPASRHRWCIRLIMKKFPEKLSGNKDYDKISYFLKQVVYDSLTVEEFEAAWFTFIKKFELQSNKWLDGLYVEKARWVPAFLKDTFWAGMSSTQQSENMNAYFDGYIYARTTLKQFVEQYDVALTKKVENEKEEDASSWKSSIPCISEDVLETQFQSVYTNNKIRELQGQIRRMLKCQVWTRSDNEYEIKEWIFLGEGDDKFEKRVSYKVLFNVDTNETQCNCGLFEFEGMVCGHQLMVWNDRGIRKVPNKYVFKRWCKNVKRMHTKVQIKYDKSSKGVEACRRDNMYNIFKEVVESAEDHQEKYEMVMVKCRELKQELKREFIDI